MSIPIGFTPPTHIDGVTGPLSSLLADATGLVVIDSGNWHVVAGGTTQLAATVYDGTGGVSGNHLKLVDRTTLAISEITNISADANILAPYGWSPDNSQIATAYNETAGSPLEGVLVVNADNSGSTKIPLGTADASHIYDSAIGGIRWTPDGTKFIYCAYSSAVFGSRWQEIRYCAMDGSGVTVIATGPSGTDWYLLDVFADSNHILAKTENRSTHAVTFYKVSLAGAQTSLYSDPTGAIYGAHQLVERDAVLDPANLTALVATADGLSVLTLGTPALTSVYSAFKGVYRVTGAFVPPPVAHISLGDPLAGLIRLGI